MEGFVAPMLLQKREQPFSDDRFIFEPKIDGHRLLLCLSEGQVRLYTRHGNDVSRQYPELHDVPVSCNQIVLDGEVAYVNPETGAVEFETIMERFRMTKGPRIREARARLPVKFFVFDVLSVNGKDVRHLPLMERKAILDRILSDNDYFSRVLRVDGAGEELFRLIEQRGLEGIVAKRKDSRYIGRRSENWIKVINYQVADVEIAGYRKDQFGWMTQVGGRPTGIIELAVPDDHRKAFYKVAQSIVTGEDRHFVYVQPRIKARVRFRNWTKAGLLRSPEFVEFVM